MKLRLVMLFVVLMLTLMMVPAVSAQDAGPACFNLSAEDCAIINAANANAVNITSFNMDYSLDINASGLENLGGPAVFNFTSSGSGPLVLTGEGDIPVELYLDMSAALTMGEDVQDFGTFPVAIADGFAYFPTGTETVGVPLTVLLESGMEQVGSLGLPGVGGEAGANPMGALDPAMFSGLAASLAGLEAYVNYARLADVDGSIPFALTLDLGALLNSPEFSQIMTAAGALAGDDPNAAMVMGILPSILSGVKSEFVFTQYVDPEINFVDGIDLDLTFNIDISALMGQQPGAMPPISFDLAFSVDMTDYNSDLSVSAPEGARQLTEEEARAMMGTSEGM